MTIEEAEKAIAAIGSQINSIREEISALKKSSSADPDQIKALREELTKLNGELAAIKAAKPADPKPADPKPVDPPPAPRERRVNLKGVFGHLDD